MRTLYQVVLGLGLALGAAGCSNYLSAPDVTRDPTKPSVLTKSGPLYIGVQEAGPPQREGQLARWATEYTQQISGFSRQQIGFDLYQAKPSDTDTYFAAFYGSSNVLTGGGGLLDLHKIQNVARVNGDSLYLGIAKVYEAMYMGLAADMFGDVPYREAADSTNLTPHFDPQLQVYSDLQAQLDSAVSIYIPAAGPTNIGPTTDGAELIYGGRSRAGLRAVYTKVAYSLKARLFMHVAEASAAGRPGAPPAAYDSAFKYVPLGIASPDDDFLWFHDGTPNGQNIWTQWELARADVAPGAALIEVMKRLVAASVDDNQRLNFYFTSTSTGAFAGYRPTGSTGMTTALGVYNGDGIPAAEYSDFNVFINPFLGSAGDFRQPEITYAETQLIGAEAALMKTTPDLGSAQTYLDNARKNRHYGTATFGDAPGPLPATLQNIIEEKYVALFLNPEVWNDYKRTCFPSLAPSPATAGGAAPRTTPIAGRLPYGQTELNANPNAPQVDSNGQNANDPNACPVLNYVSSVPLAN